MKKRFISLLFAVVVATIFLASNAGISAETASPASAASPAGSPAPPPTLPPKLDPRAEQFLSRSCEDLASSKAFTFHAEITFDKVLPSKVKLQFAAAADYAVQRPDKLAVEFHSDLGGKEIWYDGTNVTIFDPPHMVYASTDEMFRKEIIFSAYIGVNDVNGEDCDHLAFTKGNVDWQIWLQRTGKHLPRKVVVNYRNAPGSPEYAGVLSDWKFPESIPAGVFRPDLPKDAKQIEIAKVKETKP